jgi:hypothetical protein
MFESLKFCLYIYDQLLCDVMKFFSFNNNIGINACKLIWPNGMVESTRKNKLIVDVVVMQLSLDKVLLFESIPQQIDEIEVSIQRTNILIGYNLI